MNVRHKRHRRSHRADPGDISAAAAALVERLRDGEISAERVKAAASLGHPAARHAMGNRPMPRDPMAYRLLGGRELELLACDFMERAPGINAISAKTNEALKSCLATVRSGVWAKGEARRIAEGFRSDSERLYEEAEAYRGPSPNVAFLDHVICRLLADFLEVSSHDIGMVENRLDLLAALNRRPEQSKPIVDAEHDWRRLRMASYLLKEVRP